MTWTDTGDRRGTISRRSDGVEVFKRGFGLRFYVDISEHGVLSDKLGRARGFCYLEDAKMAADKAIPLSSKSEKAK